MDVLACSSAQSHLLSQPQLNGSSAAAWQTARSTQFRTVLMKAPVISTARSSFLPQFIPKSLSGQTELAARPPGSGRPGLSVTCSGSSGKRLRELLRSPGIHKGPACYDGLSAKLVEQAGFDFAFTSGFSISAARLGLPDAGLISYSEMLGEARLIAEAVSIPVIADGDTGYGNPVNVKRTVKGFAAAGLGGILIEDQVLPKACGHTGGRRVVAREEAILRVVAAADARDEAGGDIVLVARTDARQAESLEEALWRASAFADAGADLLFVDALGSVEEMRRFCRVAPNVPKMANMLEGGGKTPILSPVELEDMGFKIVAYPLSLVGVSIRAMQDALSALKSGRLPPPSALPSFAEIQEVVGFPEYYREAEKYASLGARRRATASPPSGAPTRQSRPVEPSSSATWPPRQTEPPTGGSSSESSSSSGRSTNTGSSSSSSRDVRESGGASEDRPSPGSEAAGRGSPGPSKREPEVTVVEPEVFTDEMSSRNQPAVVGQGSLLRVLLLGSEGSIIFDRRLPESLIDVFIGQNLPGLSREEAKALIKEALGRKAQGTASDGALVDVPLGKNGARFQLRVD